MMLLLIAPVCLLLIIWSSTDVYEYKEIHEPFNCTDIVSLCFIIKLCSLIRFNVSVSYILANANL